MPRGTKKKRSSIDEDVVYAGTGYEEPGENEKRRSRRINKPTACPKRKKSKVMPKREEEDIIGGELICPHPECKNKIHISERGCNITTCTNIYAHGGRFFYFCCHCKTRCPKHISSCKCEQKADVDSRKKEQNNRNKRAELNPIYLTDDDDDDTMIDRKPSGEDGVDLEGLSNELKHDSDDGSTTSGRSSFSGTPSLTSTLPSSSLPTDDETDEDALSPPAKSDIGSQIHVRNSDGSDAGIDRKSSDDADPEPQYLSHELDTRRGVGTIPPRRSSFSGTPDLPSNLPYSYPPTDDDTLVVGSAENFVAGGIEYGATDNQAHPNNTVSMDTGTLCLDKSTSEGASSGDESNGTDSSPITDDQSPQLREVQNDDNFGGIGLAEVSTDTINQDDGGDNFPPPPPLPGQVVEARSLSITPKDIGCGSKIVEVDEAHDEALSVVSGGNRTKNECKWYAWYRHLIDYKEKHSDCLVSTINEKYKKLGLWVKFQRQQYHLLRQGKKAKITEERIAKLEEIGFVWNALEAAWESMFSALIEYKEEHGDCLVAQNDEKYKKLVSWVNQQRRQYRLLQDGKKSQITEERVVKLEKIGFCWSMRDC